MALQSALGTEAIAQGRASRSTARRVEVLSARLRFVLEADRRRAGRESRRLLDRLVRIERALEVLAPTTGGKPD